MSYSLNEVEAMAKRATRGAGYSFGMAEEAGKATRWLCAHGLDGITALGVLLELDLAGDLIPNAQQVLNSERDNCTLLVGTAVSDFSTENEFPLTIQKIVSPLLILPFVATVARKLNLCLVVSCDGIQLSTDGTRLWAAGGLPGRSGKISIAIGDVVGDETVICTRASPSAKSWGVLNSFAQHTYAPSTEESRLLGAGAGLSDND